jgi:DNA-binding winged helix-turn-helix (wHTH) protein
MVARFGAFSFDSERRQLTRERDEIHLTPKAFDLLALLIAEAPRVVTKSELHERLWTGTFVSDATLVGLVKELRRALDDRSASTSIIRTSHGVGYAFAAPLERPAVARFEVSRWLVAGDRRIVLQKGENLIGDSAAAICLASLACHGVTRGLWSMKMARLWRPGQQNGTRAGGLLRVGPTCDCDRAGVGPTSSSAPQWGSLVRRFRSVPAGPTKT